MHLLEKYLSYTQEDPLVQLAIYFAQLLIIHPFMNGNGRVARTIIPIFLSQKNLTSAPLFYLSTYFKKNRLEYFDRLFSISSEKKWLEWIRFFLKGIIEEGTKNLKKAEKLLKVYNQLENILGHTRQAKVITKTFLTFPILDTRTVSSKKKMREYLQKLKTMDLIVPYRKTKPIVAIAQLSTIVK